MLVHMPSDHLVTLCPSVKRNTGRGDRTGLLGLPHFYAKKKRPEERNTGERARGTRAFDGGIWNAITNQQAQFFSSVFSGPRKIFFLMGRDGEDDEDLPSLSVYVHPRGSLRAADARGHMAVDD